MKHDMKHKQPEALRLADELEKCWADPGLQLKAGAELRRLHSEVEFLNAIYCDHCLLISRQQNSIQAERTKT